jgi:hypothetical protein
MEFSPTLQDFVLNLIYDPGARSAFELDPHGTLEAAGLSDITAADVQDVLPLVLDYAPLGTVPATAGLSQVDEVTARWPTCSRSPHRSAAAPTRTWASRRPAR